MTFTLPEALCATIRNYGHRPAFLTPERSFTWQEAGDRISRLADSLFRLRIRPGHRVAILARNNFRYEELKYAAFWLGAASVQLNWRMSAAELRTVLADCNPEVLFADDEFAYMNLHPQTIVLGAESDRLLEAGRPRQPTSIHEDTDAILFYTSGTTGNSKGVQLTHRNILHAAFLYQGGTSIRPLTNDVYLHVSPMFHAAELLSMPWFFQGAAHLYLPSFSPASTLEAIERYRVSCVNTVPTMLIKLITDDAFPKADLSSLRVLLFGSASMAAEWVERAIRAFPSHVGMFQGYGLTETAPNGSMLEAELLRAAVLEKRRPELVGSVGRPLAGISVKIVDPNGADCAPGQPGEILLRGPNIMKGYLNRPEDTARVKKNGWFHTGDLGKLDEDGYLFILDRIKDMIITGGENVYSAEVETVLSAHPAIHESAVFGIPHDVFGETVAAAIVLQPGVNLTADEVIAFCRTRIAGYKVPKLVAFVDDLPRTPIGKVAKTTLRKNHAEIMKASNASI